MSSSFELRFVFGLFVLCVFHSFSVEAMHKRPLSRSSSDAVRHRPLSGVLRTSQTLESHRLQPTFTAQETHRLLPRFPSRTSLSSMSNVNLRSPSSSSSSSSAAIHRTVSSSSLNTANSPSMMREMSTSHRQAATLLNRVSLTHEQNPSLLQRALPNLGRISAVGKSFLKNGALIAGGAGGVLIVAKAFNGDEHNKENKSRKEEETLNEKQNMSKSITTTTRSPEMYNRIGTDK